MAVPSALILVARWLLALVAPGAALGLALLLRPLVDQVPSPPFVAAVLVVAWLGGFRPALLATVVSGAALDYYFLPPPHDWLASPREAVWLMVFGAVCVGTAWVVAGRGRVQGRLASSEQLLRLVTDTAPQLIYYIDAGRRYRFVNRPYADRYGLGPADIIGRHVAEVVSPERYTSIERHLTDALAGRRTSFELTRQVEGGVRHCT